MRRMISLVALTAAAAAAAERIPKTARQFRVRVPVSSESAAPLTGGEFRVSVNGKPARIARARGPADDMILLLVVDFSGDLVLIDAAREAIVRQLRQLPASVWAGLLRAQDGLRVLADPSPDREEAIRHIQSLTVGARPGLLETIELASQLGDEMLAKASPRLAILFVTDSNVYGYREDFTNPVINSSDWRDLSRRFPEGLVREKILKIEDTLASRQPPVFIVHLDYRSDRINEAYQVGLMQLAKATGGQGIICRTLVEVPEAIEKALASARAHWNLELELAAMPDKKIEFTVENGSQNLTYRSSFVLKR